MTGHSSFSLATSDGLKTFEFDFFIPLPSEEHCKCFIPHNCNTCLRHGFYGCEYPERSPDGTCSEWDSSYQALLDGKANYLAAIQAIHNGDESHE